MRTGTNLSLTIWDEGDDPYDHTELAANWDALDAHDHTSGKGVQIPGAGLANGSVTNPKLAPNAVTTDKIQDGTILAADLADGIIGASKIDPTLFQTVAPIGMIVPFFRPNTSFVVPTGWAICDGSVLGEVDHDWTGAGNVSLPDLRNKFVLGAALSGTGAGTGTPPAENAVGGNHNRSFNHSHTVAGHSHTVAAHNHSLSSGGLHNHSGFTGTASGDDDTMVNITGGTNGMPDHGHNHFIGNDGAHDHGGTTGNTSPATNSVLLTTDATAVGGDLRPAFVGLLYIIKVRHA